MQTSDKRYTAVAIALHWIMAVAFILMLASGLAFDRIEMDKPFQFKLYQWHKSLGLLLLAAFFIRIGWRLFHKPPALPDFFPKWERLAAHAGHIGLYAMMFIMPVAGWIMVSSSPFGLPTIIFGLFEWPHIPGVAGNKSVHDTAGIVHEIGGWLFLIFIGGHIAAVIKHLLVDKYNLLPRMGIGTYKE